MKSVDLPLGANFFQGVKLLILRHAKQHDALQEDHTSDHFNIAIYDVVDKHKKGSLKSF